MMVKGYVTNNTGRSRHIFKRTVYPGQRVPLDDVYKVVSKKVPQDTSFVDWLQQYLPSGWEIKVSKAERPNVDGREYKETLTAEPVVADNPSEEDPEDVSNLSDEDGRPSLEYATPKVIDRMSARDIYNLRIKDNPRRLLKFVTSIHKLRRALTMCKEDSRKATLSRLIQGRIRELNLTL